MVVFIGEDVPECYENISNILDELQMDNLTVALSCDLKLVNIILGLQSHSSTYGCSWCTIKTRGEGKYSGFAPSRTIKNITENAQDFKDMEANKKRPNYAKYFNCIEQPLLKADPSAKIIELIVPPELHLFIGMVRF